MNRKEKIGKIPAWKAGIVFLAIALVGVYTIEVMIISKVFYAFDVMIMSFDALFESDKRDLEEFREQYKKDNELSEKRYQETSKKLREDIHGNQSSRTQLESIK